MECLKEVDPKCTVDWSNHEDINVFHRAFIAPSATWHALHYYPLVVALDACYTKNRKFPCQLFLATVLDGNMQGLILGYAIALVENTDN